MLVESFAAIRAARPGMSPLVLAVAEAILLAGGSIGSARAVARGVGLPSRFCLARLLRREGLPPLHRLAGWAAVLSWVRAWERGRTSLSRLAFRSRRHPSACYRLVKEVTGLTWEHVRARGSGWVERELLREVRATRPTLGR